jgi:hypothetical protein
MASSYFDLPPQKNVEAAAIQQVPEEERKRLGKMSLMSPAVSQLLEDLGNEHSDSSSSEEGSLSEEEDTVKQKEKKSNNSGQSLYNKKTPSTLRPSSLSPNRPASRKGSAHVKPPSVRSSGSGPARQKPTQMTRFQSLRSMLFQATIEDKMKTATKEVCRKEADAANKWKSQHEQRQMHRPKTPEEEQSVKPGIGSRLKTSLRRMTSKEVPTLQNIGEDEGAVAQFDDHASTASSDVEDESRHPEWKNSASDNERIDHSDIGDLERRVSRRDPPSDGEARKGAAVHSELVEDSGHESLGQSDVDDLVKWVSRRSDADAERAQDHHTGYSDASTESDSELFGQSSEEEEDADSLMRWISHRDGPKAGPVRRNLERPKLDSEVEQHYDSDVPELSGWLRRHDGTSGESAASTSVRGSVDLRGEEEERGRPRSRDAPSPIKHPKTHLTDNDVDELVRWVSRKDSKQQETSTRENDDRTLEWNRQEQAKKKLLSMTADDGSFSHNDVQDLLAHIHKDSSSPQNDLHNMTPTERDAADFADKAHVKTGRAESTQMDKKDLSKSGQKQKKHRESLGDEDVNELVSWISNRH